jgi:hypothetical protein
VPLECETENRRAGHETPAINGIVNERANGSETGTRIESESEIGIENEIMTERMNGSESENGAMNKSANKNRSVSQTEYMSNKTRKDESISGALS